MLQTHKLRTQSGKAWPMVIIVLLLGALAGYWHFHPEQQPDWIASWLPTAPEAEVTLYRWQNASGEWTVSSEPPAAGIEFEVVSYRHDTNVMPAVSQADDD